MFSNRTFLIISLFFVSSLLTAQSTERVYEYFDQTVGLENSILFNGYEFQDPEITRNDKNKFLFPGDQFQDGSITYGGQYFPDVKLKFNIPDDKIFVRIQYENAISSFQLISKKIDSFSIREKTFIRLENGKDVSGFYEKLSETKGLGLYKKYHKNGKRRLNTNFLYYEFFFSDPAYVISYDSGYSEINSRNDFIDIFPDKKKVIKDFYRNNRSLLKENSDLFMQNFISHIINQSNRNN